MTRVAIAGSTGRLGRQLVAACERAGDEVLALHRPSFDLARAADDRVLLDWRPEVLINAAAWSDVDGCARDPQRAMRVNGEAAGQLALAADRLDALAVQISTNEVFDGEAAEAYVESASPAPRNAYGASKLLGEQSVADTAERHLIIRTAWLFGPDGSSFISRILTAAQRAHEAGTPLRVVEDEWGNPTWIPVLADAILASVRLAPARSINVLHLAGVPEATRFGWAEVALASLGHAAPRLERITSADFVRASAVPLRAVLDTSVSRSLGIEPIEWREPSRQLARALVAAAGAT